jgi:hypothetical protein
MRCDQGHHVKCTAGAIRVTNIGSENAGLTDEGTGKMEELCGSEKRLFVFERRRDVASALRHFERD